VIYFFFLTHSGVFCFLFTFLCSLLICVLYVSATLSILSSRYFTGYKLRRPLLHNFLHPPLNFCHKAQCTLWYLRLGAFSARWVAGWPRVHAVPLAKPVAIIFYTCQNFVKNCMTLFTYPTHQKIWVKVTDF